MTPELAQKILRGGSEAIAVVRGIYQTHVEKLDALESDARKILDAAAMLPLVWIPVSERLPEDGEQCLAARGDDVGIVWWHSEPPQFIHEDIDNAWIPTHWMPLPEPPEAK